MITLTADQLGNLSDGQLVFMRKINETRPQFIGAHHTLVLGSNRSMCESGDLMGPEVGRIFGGDQPIINSIYGDGQFSSTESSRLAMDFYSTFSDQPNLSLNTENPNHHCFQDFMLAFGGNFDRDFGIFRFKNTEQKTTILQDHQSNNVTFEIKELDLEATKKILETYIVTENNKSIKDCLLIVLNNQSLDERDKQKFLSLFATNERFQNDFIEFVEKTIAFGPGLLFREDKELDPDMMTKIRENLASDLLKRELGIYMVEAINTSLLPSNRPNIVGQAEPSTSALGVAPELLPISHNEAQTTPRRLEESPRPLSDADQNRSPSPTVCAPGCSNLFSGLFRR